MVKEMCWSILLSVLCKESTAFLLMIQRVAAGLAPCDIQDDKIMLYFDVVSRFTAIPVTKACDYIQNKLECDESLYLGTQLDTTDLVSLLKFILSNNYFVFNNRVYKQIHGCAMSNPNSPWLPIYVWKQSTRWPSTQVPFHLKYGNGMSSLPSSSPL